MLRCLIWLLYFEGVNLVAAFTSEDSGRFQIKLNDVEVEGVTINVTERTSPQLECIDREHENSSVKWDLTIKELPKIVNSKVLLTIPVIRRTQTGILVCKSRDFQPSYRAVHIKVQYPPNTPRIDMYEPPSVGPAYSDYEDLSESVININVTDDEDFILYCIAYNTMYPTNGPPIQSNFVSAKRESVETGTLCVAHFNKEEMVAPPVTGQTRQDETVSHTTTDETVQVETETPTASDKTSQAEKVVYPVTPITGQVSVTDVADEEEAMVSHVTVKTSQLPLTDITDKEEAVVSRVMVKTGQPPLTDITDKEEAVVSRVTVKTGQLSLTDITDKEEAVVTPAASLLVALVATAICGWVVALIAVIVGVILCCRSRRATRRYTTARDRTVVQYSEAPRNLYVGGPAPTAPYSPEVTNAPQMKPPSPQDSHAFRIQNMMKTDKSCIHRFSDIHSSLSSNEAKWSEQCHTPASTRKSYTSQQTQYMNYPGSFMGEMVPFDDCIIPNQKTKLVIETTHV